MAKIPPAVALCPDSIYLLGQSAKLYGQGKVRDTFDLGDYLLVVHTDRLSIFDFVLPILVPGKGKTLANLAHFWFNFLKGVPNHLTDASHEEKEFRTRFPKLDWGRCLLVEKRKVQPFELIFRAHIGGSVWKDYLKKGIVAGQKLPEGLIKWQRLDQPLFTPSTKSETGHDVNISAKEYRDLVGAIAEPSIQLAMGAYQRAYEYAWSRGFLILDTKLELSLDSIVDEVFTPDSSRFTTPADFEKALLQGRDPIFYDKEVARIWGRTVTTPFVYTDDDERKDPNKKKGTPITGINNLEPENPFHVAYVHTLTVPLDVMQTVSSRYLELFERLTGVSADTYQHETRGIPIEI